MRNLFPASARPEASADLRAAAALAREARTPSGAGWSDLHVAEAPSTTYADVGLKIHDAAAALEPIMPRVKAFSATAFSAIGSGATDPWGVYQRNAWCYGFGAHCFIKLEAKGDDLQAVWFDFCSDDPGDMAALRAAMEAIDRLAPSMIVDYSMNASATVADVAQLDAYFARRGAEIAHSNEWLRRRQAPRGGS